jgi:hypothetical protein
MIFLLFFGIFSSILIKVKSKYFLKKSFSRFVLFEFVVFLCTKQMSAEVNGPSAVGGIV